MVIESNGVLAKELFFALSILIGKTCGLFQKSFTNYILMLYKLSRDALTPDPGAVSVLISVGDDRETLPAVESGHVFWLLGICHYGYRGIF